MSDDDREFDELPPVTGPPEQGLDWQTHDDPTKGLWKALAEGDAERAMGAFRLLEASGSQPDLEPTLALELADLLEKNERYLDAARACRMAAEIDLDGPEAPVAILRGAKLLLGPAANPQAGTSMLRFYLERWPTHRLHLEARKLLDQAESGENLGLEARPTRTGVAAHNERHPGVDPGSQAPPVRGGGLARAIQALVGRVGSDRYRALARVFKIVTILVALLFATTYYLATRASGAGEIHPDTLKAPVQTALNNPKTIKFSRNGYAYRLTPKFDYLMHGLIVSLRDYTFMSSNKSDVAWPMDLCVIWGSTVKNGAHTNSNVEFDQHGRFCVFKYRGRNPVRNSELSNNHLLLKDPELEDVLDRLGPGDQIRLKGQLVDVDAILLEGGGAYDAPRFKMRSSVVRTDTGGGACEIIYVSELQIIKKANRFARWAKGISFWILMGLFLTMLARLVFLPIRLRDAS